MTTPGNKLWSVEYVRSVVEKDIPKLDHAVRTLIKKSIEQKLMRAPLVFSKPLQYSLKGHRRLRVGDFRVVFSINHESHVLTILMIKHRRDIYEE